jgi:hypothetical protein
VGIVVIVMVVVIAVLLVRFHGIPGPVRFEARAYQWRLRSAAGSKRASLRTAVKSVELYRDRYRAAGSGGRSFDRHVKSASTRP